MKLKDLVANSLPRVRGRKSKKAALLHPANHASSRQEPEFSTHAPYFMQHQHPAFESRESSVERSSTVAVVDAPWRDGATYATKADRKPCDMGLVTQSMTYYTPLTHQQHGMVMSHSADGIASQAMMLASPRDYVSGSKVTSLSEHYAMTGYQHPNMAATSETAVNYIGPNYVYHAQHQHQHHHHHHSHDHHYVYHHHHHDRQQCHTQPQPQIPKPDPLTERNSHQNTNGACANPKSTQQATEKPRKPESGGFLRKSFASFRAMRKPGSRNKEKESRTKSHSDENDKCLVCPYPQPQATTDKNGGYKKSSKQSKKEMKSLMKSMKGKHNSSAYDKASGDASWCSDSDTHKVYQNSHHPRGYDTVPYSTINSFPVRECSMEGSISRHTVAGSRERMDQQYFETASLSGYDSDVTKNRSGRSRSRIKTNPWLPSPQPSLTMGRRFENCRALDNNDVMDDESPGCFPRSASFDYHSQLGVSTFLSSSGQNEQKRSIQRHRSLTPVDLKLNLSLPRTKKTESPKPPNQQTHLNDLNTKLTKSRPNSIISPNSEFVALADNIEQLANNISFEYEDSFDTGRERGATPGRESATTPTAQFRRHSEESNTSKKRKSGSSPPLATDSVSSSAHSPDSGIGCLGSCDGDDSMTLGNTVVLEQSPTVSIPSSQSTNSDSLNTTPKRKSSKTTGNVDGNGKTKKSSTSVSSKRLHDGEKDNLRLKDNHNPEPSSQSIHEAQRLIGSSSSESITSAVVSESDIDNTSYKFVETNYLKSIQSPLPIDPLKPQNVIPCLMVDERLDINFRSLPRKLNGKTQHHHHHHLQQQQQAKKRAEKDGRFTISRSRNVIAEKEQSTPSLMLFPGDEKSSSLSLTSVTKDKNGNCKGGYGEIELKCNASDRNGESEMAVNYVDLGSSSAFKQEPETGDSITMDTVDACVQTDFLLDLDSTAWDRKQPSGLSPLDDSFDPVESTRRWLISGNMQGSADTGYSSQPRDSHVFMEEEAAMLQLETLSDASGGCGFNPVHCKTKAGSNTSSSCRGKVSPLECESPCGCGGCGSGAMTSLKQHKSSCSRGQGALLGSPDNEVEIRHESIFPECTLSNLLHSLKPPMENDFDDVENVTNTSQADVQVSKRHAGERTASISDVNKRHSSDSSTSTLTSDVLVENDNDIISFDNINDDSFVCLPARPRSDPWDMEDDEYHDYVNLPVRYFGAKSQSKIPPPPPSPPHVNHSDFQCGDTSMLNGKRRCHENKLRAPKHPHQQHSFDSSHKTLAIFDEANKFGAKGTGNTHNNSFRCVEGTSNHQGEDRPDYLEFLRDAPLHHPPSTANQVFIVPGFGPLEFPTGMIYPLSSKGSFRNLQQKSSNVLSDNAINQGKDASPQCAKLTNFPKRSSKPTKQKKEERPTHLNLLSYNCCSQGSPTGFSSAEQTPQDAKEQIAPHPSSSLHGKRKPQKDSTSKTNRCPTVRSYDVDDFAPINRVDLTSTSSPSSCSTPTSSSAPTSSSTSRQDRSGGSTRNLADRVAILRREKEIIYRKIQEVQQQQEMDRQREQFQQHRNLHSQRKDELLETLRVLKDKLEEQSKALQTKCREEI